MDTSEATEILQRANDKERSWIGGLLQSGPMADVPIHAGQLGYGESLAGSLCKLYTVYILHFEPQCIIVLWLICIIITQITYIEICIERPPKPKGPKKNGRCGQVGAIYV